ncbi:hypothetical protein [Niallia nealsonii]|uniref:Uncharacterized protein n=1 Tax=Niallia nealsonii TaxID=115979 RepID=A0A2N0Z721_9BACI|nr:hypothetical protein [Niallia nealsonii]PKG25312.1 hypothetical protein CWS01_02205 [Niallia nealsonii]
MADLFKIIAEIVNIIHDVIMVAAAQIGWQATDKDLHLWIIGIIGIVSFFIVQAAFKRLAKWSITSISFIYTFTLVLVLVFAIEIQQGITGRGHMEFADAVVGIYGFLLFFGVYIVFKGIRYGLTKLIKKEKKENENGKKGRRYRE